MILLIAGASHTGKTAFAQKILEKYHYPYLSIDHLKMGLIRSSNTTLTPTSDDKELTDYLWPIVREMIKTAIENGQNLVVEGCYIPFNWTERFGQRYLKEIKYFCLIMSEAYIRSHIAQIRKYADVIEQRLDDSDCTADMLIRDNMETLEMCRMHGLDYVLIDDRYNVSVDLVEV